MLAAAVVVAGDRPRADVHVLADHGIAKVGMVAGFATLSEHGLLQLHEIPDVHRVAQLGVRANVYERPDSDARCQAAAADNAEVLDSNAIGEYRVHDTNAGVYLARLADLRPPLEMHARVDDGIGAHDHVIVNVGGCRIFDRHARGHH